MIKRTKILISLGVLTVVVIVGGFFIYYYLKPLGINKAVKVGERTEISFKEAKLVILPESLKQDAVINVKIVKSPPLPSTDLQYVSETYEFTSNQPTFEQPVVIALRYDPAKLPDPGKENNLYLATWQNNNWLPVEGGIINKTNHTVTAAVDHFSDFSILYSPTELLFKNIVGTIAYGDLPNQIKEDLIDSGYAKANIKALVRAEAAQVTKLSTFVIAAANAINEVSGLAIGAAQNAQEFAKELVMKTTTVLLKKFGGQAGEIGVRLFEFSQAPSTLLDAGIKTYKFGAGALTNTVAVQATLAKVAAWVLSLEMDYINNNMDGGLKDLWKLNPLDPNRLELYIVLVDVPYDKDGLNQRGIKYYYHDSPTDSYVNYYNNLVGAKLELDGQPIPPAEYTFSATSPFEYPEGLNVDKEIVDTDLNYRGGYSQKIRICSGSHCPKRQLIYDTDVAHWYKIEAEKAGWWTLVNKRGKDRIRQVFVKDDLEFALITNWMKNSKDGTKDDLIINIYWGPKYPITTVADYEKLSGNCERQIIMNLNLEENFILHPTFNFPLYEGKDATGKIKILSTEELEVNKTYRLKGCKTGKVFTKSVGETVFFVRPEWPEAAFKSIEDVIKLPPEAEKPKPPPSEATPPESTESQVPTSGNIALKTAGAKATADSYGSYGGYDATPDKAIDGDNNTFWAGTKVWGWFQVEFAKPYQLEKIGIYTYYHTQNYQVFVSTDGEGWREVVHSYISAAGKPSGEGKSEYKEFPVKDKVEFKYLKIYINESDAPASHIYKTGLIEVAAFTPAPPDPWQYPNSREEKNIISQLHEAVTDITQQEEKCEKQTYYIISPWQDEKIISWYKEQAGKLGWQLASTKKGDYESYHILTFVKEGKTLNVTITFYTEATNVIDLCWEPSVSSITKEKEETANPLVYPGATEVGGGMSVKDPDGKFSCRGQVYAVKGVTRDQIVDWYLNNLPKLGWAKTGERGPNSPVFQKGNQFLWFINVYNIESLPIPNKRKLTSDEIPFMLCR